MKNLLALFFISIMIFKYLPIRDISKNIYAVNTMLDDENSKDDVEKKDINESKDYCIVAITNYRFSISIFKNASLIYSNVNDLQLYNTPLEITTPPPIA